MVFRLLAAFSLLLPFAGQAQEEGYLYENFNKETAQTFPPYGWSQIDADGDGAVYTVSVDGVDNTMSANSYIWLIGTTYQPDNWLVTPALYVEKETDSLKYWVGSYKGASNYLEVWVSRKSSSLEDFTVRVDTVLFDGSDETRDHENRAFSLKEFVGDTIYVAFRHLYRAELPDIDNTINLALDNIQGPRIVQFPVEAGIEEIRVFDGVSEPCDIADQPVTVYIANLGSTPISDFDVYCQSQGIGEEGGNYILSPIVKGHVDAIIQPGQTYEYTFPDNLPFSQYRNSGWNAVYIRAFLGVEGDPYPRNDTLVTSFYKQNSFQLPMTTGFEQDDPVDEAFNYWYTSYRPDNYTMPPFSIGMNSKFAHAGTNYLTCGVYAPFSATGAANNGSDLYAATRCVLLEEGKDYSIDLFYGFRKLPAEWPNQELRFRVVCGKDQQDLLNHAHTVLFDTVLEKTEDLVSNEKAAYSLFSSEAFRIEEAGAYYLGLVFYSDSLVQESTDEWMIFIDDFTLRYTESEVPVDLELQEIVLPYDCNLTEAEPVSFVIRNTSVEAVSDVAVAYKVGNGEWIRDTIREEIGVNASCTYTFETKADFSGYGKYRVEGEISHPRDSALSNNSLVTTTENSEVLELPFTDDFEEYGILLNFEDEWKVLRTGYYGYMAAVDYTTDTAFAYNGVGFMADAEDNEKYVAPDDWAIGRCLAFKKGESYDISFAYRIEAESPAKTNLEAWILASYDTASKVEQVARLSDIRNVDYRILQYTFTPQEDMIGHFAFHTLGEVGAPIIMIDALKIGVPFAGNESRPEAFFEVYPNPARGKLNVVSAQGMRRVLLYDISGREVLSMEAAGTHVSIDAGAYGQGLYLMVVEDCQGERAVKKVVIER